MRRCSLCGDPFGLTRHRYFGKQFCTARCKEAYLQSLIRRAARERTRLARSLGVYDFQSRDISLRPSAVKQES
jgi:hypothetical protein